MKVISKLCLALILAASTYKATAQNLKTCGTDDAEKMMFEEHPELLQQYLKCFP